MHVFLLVSYFALVVDLISLLDSAHFYFAFLLPPASIIIIHDPSLIFPPASEDAGADYQHGSSLCGHCEYHVT